MWNTFTKKILGGNGLKKVLLLIMFVLILTGCGAKEADVTETLTAEDHVTKLKEAGLPIDNVIVFTAETDPNEMLGRPNGYTSKVNFADTTIEQFGDDPVGGSIEVFENEKDVKNRKEYIDSIGEEMQLFAEYSYVKGSVLLRLDSALTPEQAEKYKAEFEKIQ
jgi:hypothetical protein